MGVKELWALLSPIKQELPLSELRGKTVAVDLSCWICQANTAKALCNAVLKPHLRNLFFRIHRLYCQGVSLVMVVDGEATPLKWSVMDRRERERGGLESRGNNFARKTGHRRQLNTKIKECCQLLDALGVPYLHSKGEAEAMCALINGAGLVDGVLTEDSDVFLYGAHTVYRDLSTNEKDSKVEKYTASDIHCQLGMTRRDLVGLALLLGCDYCPRGIPGVGKESVLKLLHSSKQWNKTIRSCDLLSLFQIWGEGKLMDENDIIEKQIQKKSLAISGFPDSNIISEFLQPGDTLPVGVQWAEWRMPSMRDIQRVCSTELQWTHKYAYEKVLPLLTQWVIRHSCHSGEGGCSSENNDVIVESRRILSQNDCDIRPLRYCIVCDRVKHGVASYEVEWEGCHSIQPLHEIDGVLEKEGASLSDEHSSSLASTQDKRIVFTTIEVAKQFKLSFSILSSEHEKRKLEKKPRKSRIKGPHSSVANVLSSAEKICTISGKAPLSSNHSSSIGTSTNLHPPCEVESSCGASNEMISSFVLEEQTKLLSLEDRECNRPNIHSTASTFKSGCTSRVQNCIEPLGTLSVTGRESPDPLPLLERVKSNSSNKPMGTRCYHKKTKEQSYADIALEFLSNSEHSTHQIISGSIPLENVVSISSNSVLPKCGNAQGSHQSKKKSYSASSRVAKSCSVDEMQCSKEVGLEMDSVIIGSSSSTPIVID